MKDLGTTPKEALRSGDVVMYTTAPNTKWNGVMLRLIRVSSEDEFGHYWTAEVLPPKATPGNPVGDQISTSVSTESGRSMVLRLDSPPTFETTEQADEWMAKQLPVEIP